MAKHEVQVHEVEYLSVANATITDGDPPIQRPITIRPDENSFRPHNLSVPRDQAARLLEDLKAVLSRSAVCLVLLLAGGGCSGEVEFEEETTTPMSEIADAPPARTAVTKERTRVAVDLLMDQGTTVMEDGQALETLGGMMINKGCIHFHQTLIIHLDDGDRNSEQTAIEIIREWQGEGCGRHQRE
jgi:hypothetical protein